MAGRSIKWRFPMFARTERTLLRPGWSEDIPALHSTVSDREIARNLARMPWPYHPKDAAQFINQDAGLQSPHLLISLRTQADPVIIGAIALRQLSPESASMGYWIARPFWGRGFASEAGQAVIEIAEMLGYRQLKAWHFIDNPASGAVLKKLGFVATDFSDKRQSLAREQEAAAMGYRLAIGKTEQSGSMQPLAA